MLRTRSATVYGWAVEHPVAATLTVALLARIPVIVGLQLIFGSQPVFGDDGTYVILAENFVRGETALWAERDFRLVHGNATFMYPLIAAFRLFGPWNGWGGLIATFYSCVAAAVTVLLVREVLQPRWALFAGLGVALLPSLVLWSSLALKDSAVWAVLAAGAYVLAIAAEATRRTFWAAVAGQAVVLLLLSRLRPHTMVVAGVAFVIAALVLMARRRWAPGLVVIAVAVLAPYGAGFGLGGAKVVAKAGSLEERRVANAASAQTAFVAPWEESQAGAEDPQGDRPGNRRPSAGKGQARGGSGDKPGDPARRDPTTSGSRGTGPGTAGDREATLQPAPTGAAADLARLPRGLSVMLLEPFPWRDYGNARLRLAQLETLMWYPLLLLAGLGMLRTLRHPRVLAFPALIIVGISVMYALTEGNIGTAYRHRGEYAWAVCALAAWGAQQVQQWMAGRSARTPEQATVRAG